MAQWSQKVQQQKKMKQTEEVTEHRRPLLELAIKRRLAAMHLLRKNGWHVRAVLHLPVEWHSRDIVVCEDDVALLEVDFLVEMPGSAFMIVRGIESLERKSIGMR
jgi:hypothetical protein